MPNRLSRFCDGVMEAGWLLALVLTPLFFNIYSSRVFEPDKIALVRSLALIVLAAWLIKIISEGGLRLNPLPEGHSRMAALYRLPLVIPVGALMFIYIIATLFSVSPHASLLGSYQRSQGLFSTFSYITLFAAIAVNLRRRAQVERIITTVILTSLPISVYGLIQRFQKDPLPWGGDTVSRVTGNMGNAIFIAAYLIMAMLLTLGRVVRVFRAILAEDENEQLVPNIVRASSYVFILAVNALTIYFSFSRGPWLGLFAGLYIFVLAALTLLRRQDPDRKPLTPQEIGQALLFSIISLPVLALPAYGVAAALKRGWRWLWLSWVMTAVMGIGVLVAFNIPAQSGPLAQLQRVPGLNRMGQILDEIQGNSGTGRVRVLIWSGIIEMMTPHAPIEYPDGSVDRWNALRPFIGYGPEAIYVAYNPFYPPELAQLEARNATPDRSHNETFDALAFTGLIGLFVHFTLFVAVFYYSLKWLGFVGSAMRRTVFLVLVIGGAVAGAAGFIVWQGPEFLGVGLPFGMLLGLILFLTATALNPGSDAAPLELWRSVTLMSLFAAIVAHFTEIHFGIAIVSTRTHFWVYVGLMLAVGYAMPRTTSAAAPAVADPNRLTRRKARPAGKNQTLETRPWTAVFISAGVGIALLITLGYDFLTNATRSISSVDILVKSLTFLPQKNQASLAILLMVTAAWLIGVAVAYLEEARRAPGRFNVEELIGALGLSLVVGGVAWLIISGQLAAIATPPPQPRTTEELTQQVLGSAQKVVGILNTFYWLMLFTLLGWAAALATEIPLPARGANLVNTHPAALVGYGLLPLIALLLSIGLNLQSIQADTVYKTGFQMDNEGRPQLAEPLYQEAIRLAPGEDYYFLFLGRALLNLVSVEADPSQQAARLAAAEQELKFAQSLNPLNPDHTANLARLNRQWAVIVQADPLASALHSQQANDYYDRVTHLSRHSALLYNEWALLSFQLLNNPQQAQEKLDISFGLDDKWEQTYQYQGDLYLWQASRTAEAEAQKAFYQKALDVYKQGLAVAEARNTNIPSIHVSLSNIYVYLQQWQDALNEYQILLSLNDPNIAQWQVYREIARMYWNLGQPDQARANAQLAVDSAPEANKAEAQAFLDQLK